MLADIFKKEEKKVEYIELIYDLIFVYIIGRNNSLISSVEHGFIRLETYGTYLLTTIIVLQIWYFTTLFINRYGTNGVAEHIGLFVNMYLLYYMADGTRTAWQDYYFKYNIAWGLILLNLAFWYFLKLRKSDNAMPWQKSHIRFNMIVIGAEALCVFASLPVYHFTGIPLSPFAFLVGAVAVVARRDINTLVSLDFSHLTERVMLYVVFTFGEMIISISGYFKGGVTFRSVYFSLMAFLIVTGLFLIYGYFYDHIIDREQSRVGTGYMFLHIFLITALNNISVGLEFMREPEVSQVPKNIFIVASFIAYFVFLFCLERYAYGCKKPGAAIWVVTAGLSALFVTAAAALYKINEVSIGVAVVYIFSMLAVFVIHSRKHKRSIEEECQITAE